MFGDEFFETDVFGHPAQYHGFDFGGSRQARVLRAFRGRTLERVARAMAGDFRPCREVRLFLPNRWSRILGEFPSRGKNSTKNAMPWRTLLKVFGFVGVTLAAKWTLCSKDEFQFGI